MKKSIPPLALGAVVAAAICAEATAQRRIASHSFSHRLDWPYRTATQSGDGLMVSRTRFDPLQGDTGFVIIGQEEILDVPIDSAGDVDFDPGTLDFILCSGKYEDAGRIVVFQRSVTTRLLEQTAVADYPGWDLGGIAERNNELFVLDAANRVVRRAPWTLGNPLPAPGAFEVIATESDLWVLSRAHRYRIFATIRNGNLVVQGVGATPDDAGIAGFVVTLTPSGVTTEVINEELEMRAGLIEPIAVGATSIPMVGFPGKTVEIVDVGTDPAMVLGAVTLDAAGQGVATIPAASFGPIYTTRTVGFSNTGRWHVAELRYGAPESLPGEWSILPFAQFGLTCYPANGFFSVPLTVDAEGEVTQERTLDCHLLVGVFGVNPVHVVGDRALLDTAVSVAAPARLDALAGGAFTAAQLPLPADENLLGGVLLFQWVVIDGTHMRLSEVLGLAVQPRPPMPTGIATLLGALTPADAPQDNPRRHRHDSPSADVKVRSALRAVLERGCKPLPSDIHQRLRQRFGR